MYDLFLFRIHYDTVQLPFFVIAGQTLRWHGESKLERTFAKISYIIKEVSSCLKILFYKGFLTVCFVIYFAYIFDVIIYCQSIPHEKLRKILISCSYFVCLYSILTEFIHLFSNTHPRYLHLVHITICCMNY